jgi:thiamine-monophosphate kinase
MTAPPSKFPTEDEITAELKQIFTPTYNHYVRLGIGDDCAVIRADDDYVVTTDVLVDGVHFVVAGGDARLQTTAENLARRAFAQNLADVVAMGAKGVAMVVSLVLPLECVAVDYDFTLRFARELASVATAEGVAVVGGDLSKGSNLVVNITAFGDLQNQEPLLRSDAKSGDVLAVCGDLGLSQLGYELLTQTDSIREYNITAQCAERAKQQFLAPNVQFKAGEDARRLGAHALMDVSDGLLRDAARMGRASNVQLQLDSARIAQYNSADDVAIEVRHKLTGGEDHAFLAAFPPDVDFTNSILNWQVIGEVKEIAPNTIAGVQIIGEVQNCANVGWDHFGGATSRKEI